MTRREAIAILERAREAERAHLRRLLAEIERLQDQMLRSSAAVRQLENRWPDVSLDRLAELVEEYGNTGGQWIEVVEDGPNGAA